MGPAISLSGRVRRAATGLRPWSGSGIIFEAEGAPPAYFKDLVEGVASHLEELDVFIVRYSEHWRLERMTIVDRNLLRLAIYELLYQPKIPPKVVINEAVEMAKRYGSEGSGGFVNGILDQVRMSVGREV